MTDASLIDLLSALQNGVQAINALQTTLLSQGSFVAGDDVVGINSISTTAIMVIEQNLDRNFLVFHNPSSAIPVYVYPTLTAASSILTHVASSPGGTLMVLPQAYLQLSGNNQAAWFGFSSAGADNPLTIMSF